MDEQIDAEPTAAGVVGLGGAVLDDDAVNALLQRLVLLALQMVTPADSVSITVADNGGYRTSNFTADEALAMDEAQYDGPGGPCLEAMRSAQRVQITVAEAGERWPVFARKAEELGVAAVLSTPLGPASAPAIGALNIYARDAGRFGDAEIRAAEIIGEHAAILVDNALALISATELNRQLQEAVASREIIGEAKGIIMERKGCTRDEAFAVLRRASQRENRKLRELAEELVARVEARSDESG